MLDVSDWSPLADEDPIPGRPDALHELVGRLDLTRDVIATQVDRIRGFTADDFWQGDAAEAFRDRQGELPDQLEMLVTRYERTSGAISGYAPDLAEAQRIARRALDQARQAEADQRRAEQGIDDMEDHARRAAAAADAHNEAHPDAPPQSPAAWGGPDWPGRLAGANEDMQAARDLLEQAKQLRDDAAQRAGDEIDDAVHDGLENDDSLWGHFKRGVTWVVDHLPVEELAQIAAIAGAVVGVLSIFFPVLAPLALTLGVLSLVLDSMLLISGDGSWVNVALDVLGIATFGLGRVFNAAGRGARTVAAAERASTTARAGLTTAEGGLAAARAGVTTAGATIASSRAARAALAARQSMAGVRATARSGNVVSGRAARLVLNARYADEMSAGERALQAARPAVTNAERAVATARAEVARADATVDAARVAAAQSRRVLPTMEDWSRFGQAVRHPVASGQFSQPLVNAGDWLRGFRGDFGWPGVVGRLNDVAGTAAGGYQVTDTLNNIFGRPTAPQPIPVGAAS
jgi:hypothetical protein